MRNIRKKAAQRETIERVTDPRLQFRTTGTNSDFDFLSAAKWLLLSEDLWR